MVGLFELTMVLDEAEEPPRLAAAGAARWTKRNVVMKGADPWASAVRADDVRVRHGGCVGLSAGCEVMAGQRQRSVVEFLDVQHYSVVLYSYQYHVQYMVNGRR